jgi:TM2 domain-containing membrane protein YozV
LAGFIGFAGVHRFITDRIGLGLLYFFTGGFLLIGTIVDLFKYKKIAKKYNSKMALETAAWMGIWKN